MKNTLSIKDNCIFRAVYRHGKSVSADTMAVYALKDRTKTVSRLGLTVSVKLGCAVQRNRMRRRLREAYRLLEDGIAEGFCVVIVARHKSLDADFAKIMSDLSFCLRKLGLL